MMTVEIYQEFAPQTGGAVNSDELLNKSSVPGASATDALNALKAQLDALNLIINPGTPSNAHLLEDGAFRLLEDGSYFLLEG